VNDFEQWLAATLDEAVAAARPPDRLMELIRRRHRRHRVLVGAVSVAAVAAITLAVPLAVPVLTSVRSPVTGPLPSPAPPYVTPGSTGPPTVGPAPGTVAQSCADQTAGAYAKNWQRRSIHVGSLWLINARIAGATRDTVSPLFFGLLPVNVRDGAHVQITVAGPARAYFRFLYGVSGTGGRYTLRDGQVAVSFTGCRRGQDGGVYPGFTQFLGGFVIAKVPACVSLDVWTKAHQPPVRISFAVGPVRAREAAVAHLACQAPPAGP
jgi:hypothetical protein